jgi:hypothetical protein
LQYILAHIFIVTKFWLKLQQNLAPLPKKMGDFGKAMIEKLSPGLVIIELTGGRLA